MPYSIDIIWQSFSPSVDESNDPKMDTFWSPEPDVLGYTVSIPISGHSDWGTPSDSCIIGRLGFSGKKIASYIFKIRVEDCIYKPWKCVRHVGG